MPTSKTEKPADCTEEHLSFLDDLRDSGVTNMYYARLYLIDEFGLDKNLAAKILVYWMKTFRGKEG